MNTEWMADALCREIGGDFWHPDRGEWGVVQIAKRVCGMCPVKDACLAHALAHDEPHGIWGGVTPKGRMWLKRQGSRFPHGTVAGYRRHHRENTKPCFECRRANYVDRQERKWTGS